MDLNPGTSLPASGSQFQTPVAASSAERDSDPVPIPKKELKALLNVNDNLASSQSKSLHVAYAKYKACNTAVQAYEQMIAKGDWPKKYQRVTVTDIRQLFVSKSVWHAQFVPCFQDIDKHEIMVEWLDSTTDVDDEAVWGRKKAAYHFADLKDWLEEKKKEAKKGKAKAKKVAKKAGEKEKGTKVKK